MPSGRNPGRPMNIRADVRAVTIEPTVAGMDPDPDSDWSVVRPRLACQGALGIDCCRNGIGGPRKHQEEAVALGQDLVPTVVRDRRPD